MKRFGQIRNNKGYLRGAVLFLSLILVIIITTATNTTVLAIPNRLVSFELQDQFGKSYSDRSFTRQNLIFLGGDRKGRKICNNLRRMLNEALSKDGLLDKTEIIDVADFRAIPGLLKNFVNSKYPKNQWALMDWDGALADTYQFDEDSCMILIFNVKRELVSQKSVADVDQVELLNAIDVISELNPLLDR